MDYYIRIPNKIIEFTCNKKNDCFEIRKKNIMLYIEDKAQ